VNDFSTTDPAKRAFLLRLVADLQGVSIITYYLSSSGAGTAVDFTAVGALNDQPGYILTGQAKDGGTAGSGLDTVSITIRGPTGELVYSSSGPVSEGDVVITP